ncbi:MAG: DUF2787 family protein [Magnetococcales bacterium]|nr:DUF2787 family protein [Magnetococcales bacterium]
MKIDVGVSPLAISKQFSTIIEKAITASGVDTKNGVIINFRDPDYSQEIGGYHPVEVMVNNAGCIQYITDFSYTGSPPFAELAKELDFDFAAGIFGHMGRDYPIKEGMDLFRVFQSNFCSYHNSDVFTVKVTNL